MLFICLQNLIILQRNKDNFFFLHKTTQIMTFSATPTGTWSHPYLKLMVQTRGHLHCNLYTMRDHNLSKSTLNMDFTLAKMTP